MLKKGLWTTGDHHSLYGKVFCANCGCVYRRRTFTSSAGTYKAWNCKERQKGKKGNGCKNKTWREDELMAAIAETMGWREFDESKLDGLEFRIDGDEIKVDRAEERIAV